jgi:hypothetical protein
MRGAEIAGEQPPSQDEESMHPALFGRKGGRSEATLNLLLFVTEGAGGVLARRQDCQALHLFKRGDRLQ